MEKVRITIDVAKLPASAIFKNSEGRKFIIVDVAARRDGEDQYGKTHTVSVWDRASDKRIYVGAGKLEVVGESAPAQPVDLGLNDDDLPL